MLLSSLNTCTYCILSPCIFVNMELLHPPQDNADNCSTTDFPDQVLIPTMKEMVNQYKVSWRAKLETMSCPFYIHVYRIAGYFCGVLIFVIIVVSLTSHKNFHLQFFYRH